MTASIIIAVKTWQKNLEECVGKCLQLESCDFEIIILPDEPIEEKLPASQASIVIIPTGPVNPSEKRDIALKYAKGEILAFLDDDAYPEKNWLKKALEDFKDADVAAVGGPAVTPPTDSLRQRVSGAIYSSFLVSANYIYRYLPGKRQEVDDYPSCNFLARKSVMQELGGFNTKFWPGEDTKLCLDITKRLGKKIIYDPLVLVYHHRRCAYPEHLKQVANYALHRGYFVKRYPETSLKLSYFIPTILVLAAAIGAVLSFILPSFAALYLAGLVLYLLLVFIFSFSGGIKIMPLVFAGIILTHATYGVFFIKGLFSRRLKEEL